MRLGVGDTRRDHREEVHHRLHQTAKRACFGGYAAKGSPAQLHDVLTAKGRCLPTQHERRDLGGDGRVHGVRETNPDDRGHGGATGGLLRRENLQCPDHDGCRREGVLRKGLFLGCRGADHRGPRLRNGRKVREALPTMNGTQTFPFPTGEEVSDPVCEKAGDGLVATKNMILAGKGDDGICRIENVDQENQGKVVRKALDQTLQETDLRTIRKEIAKVAQRVAQSGFPFAQYGNVQNLSKRLVQAARTIQSKAAQDCGGDQSMRN